MKLVSTEACILSVACSVPARCFQQLKGTLVGIDGQVSDNLFVQTGRLCSNDKRSRTSPYAGHRGHRVAGPQTLFHWRSARPASQGAGLSEGLSFTASGCLRA